MASVCQSMRLLSFLKWLPDSPVQGGHFTFQTLLLDENLMRAELSPTEHADHLTKRAELWGRRDSGQSLPTNKGRGMPKGFASETADATGVSKRAVQLATSRAKAIRSPTSAVSPRV